MEKRLLPLVQKHVHGGGGERIWARPWRWAKTAFFLAAMLVSLLLVCAPPVLVVLLDLALPPALFSATLRAAAGNGGGDFTFASAGMAQARAFDFRSSLVDLPAVSAARASLIFCAYALCGGGAAYFWVVVACAAGSMSYVLGKAAVLPRHAAAQAANASATTVAGPDAMILLSLTLAVAHLAVAYRSSCRERRRQMVYRIDVEAAVQVRLKGGHQTPKGLKQ